MEQRKQHMLIGGMILITLGVLIFLSKSGMYPFGQTWPVLLIVIGICTIAQRVRDVGGWFITVVGVIFLFTEIYGMELSRYSQYILPVVLVLLGIFVLIKRRKH
jgi:cadmium resistance protein CadD (predicted permease)